MAVEERVSVNGTILSLLLRDCAQTQSTKEGFLLGNVTKEVKTHISDSQQQNFVTETAINVTSIFPVPGIGLFYNPSGQIKEDAVNTLLSGASQRVVGWYIYRHNDSIKPTLRDRIISKGLKKVFDRSNKKFFICCHIASQLASNNATMSYSYKFNKVNSDGDLTLLSSVTNNLGQIISGYKKSDTNKAFCKAVQKELNNGATNITGAIEKVMSEVVSEALESEQKIRSVASEIDEILKELAERHRKKATSARNKEIIKNIVKEKEDFIKSMVESAQESPREPFDFVSDLIKDDLKKINRVQSTNDALPTSSKKMDYASKVKMSGHKRTHSEGTLQSSETVEKAISLSSSSNNCKVILSGNEGEA